VIAALVAAMIIGVRPSGRSEDRSTQDRSEQEARQLCAHAYLRRTQRQAYDASPRNIHDKIILWTYSVGRTVARRTHVH